MSPRDNLRLWAFRIVAAIGVPLLLLLAAEGGLRLIGYGHASTFTVPCTVQDRPAFCDNDRFTWQFFPPGAFRIPPALAIAAEKPRGTFRIFIVGESAAQGDPEPSYSFARHLEVMLRERFPGASFDIINTGITAVNSHVLLPVVRNLAHRQGDLFVLYIGNNEVVGPFGAGNSLTRAGSSIGFIRATILVGSTRLGQLLNAVISGVAGDSHRRAWHGMETFLGHQVSADDPALAAVYRNFETNLRDIIETARRSGARVLVSTVGVNLKDSPPFESAHRSGLSPTDRQRWDARVREGAELEKAGRLREALDRYRAAAALDDRYAELEYRIGRVSLALDDIAAAKAHLARARDLDVLRFRADSGINRIIRSAARAGGAGVELIDGEQVLADASPHGIPGSELFYEHVHLRPEGNYLLARALFPHVVAMLPRDIRASAPSTEPLSEAETDALLALTAFDRRRVARDVARWLEQPPFINRLDNAAQVRKVHIEADSTSDDTAETLAAYRWAVGRNPGDRWLRYNYGVVLGPRDAAAAEEQFRIVLTLLPGSYGARQMLAETLIRRGQLDEGIAQCRELLRRMPYHAPAYLTMGYALARQRSYDESIAAYERAIELEPRYALVTHNTIGLIQLGQGKFDRAAASFQAALALDTAHVGTADLLYNLGYALERLGKHTEAQQALEGARKAGGGAGSRAPRPSDVP